jgi:phosphatidylinositol alpha-1,6-mannosyltransferase
MANRELENGDTEGYGIVFLEAGAWGKPVVGGRAGGAVEAVDDGVTGIVVDGTDPGDISRAIATLLADQQLAKRMGEAGREKVRKNSWDLKSQQYCALLAGLSTKHR